MEEEGEEKEEELEVEILRIPARWRHVGEQKANTQNSKVEKEKCRSIFSLMTYKIES